MSPAEAAQFRVGDEVTYSVRRHNQREAKRAVIDRETATQWVLNDGARFRKSDSLMVGGLTLDELKHRDDPKAQRELRLTDRNTAQSNIGYTADQFRREPSVAAAEQIAEAVAIYIAAQKAMDDQ